jgi:hypothetical protein
MALIVYPTPNYDSYISVVDADDVIKTLTVWDTQWTVLTTDQKETYLRIAFRHINQYTEIDIDSSNYDACLAEAQAIIAANDVANSISAGASDQVTGAIKKQKVGQVEREFYDTTKTQRTTTMVPDIARPCLEKFGYTKQTNMLQTLLGRS